MFLRSFYMVRYLITSIAIVIIGATIMIAAGMLRAAGDPIEQGQRAYAPVVLSDVGVVASTPTPTKPSTATPTATATPTITPTPTNTLVPTLTPTTDPSLPPVDEILVFDWNKPVTIDDHGFPGDAPPLANGNWIVPNNFSEGKLYVRVEIRSIPVNQNNVHLDFCIWQNGKLANGEDFRFETCTGRSGIMGAAGTLVEWSDAIPDMYKKEGYPIDWTQPRWRNAVAIKNSQGIPISDYLPEWRWGCGEDQNCDPIANRAAWYPLDMRFTVVVVEKGKSFSGWGNYIP